MFKYIRIAILFLFVWTNAFSQKPPQEVFKLANELYQMGDYQSAQKYYESIQQKGFNNFETEFTNNASLAFESNQLNSFKKHSSSSKSANPYLVGNVGVGFVPRGTITTSEGYHNATTVLNNTITSRDRRAAGLLGVGAVLMGGALGGKVPMVLGDARGYNVAWHNMQSNTYRNTSGRANKY